MELITLTAAQATASAQVPRATIDAACSSGALRAADTTPQSSKRHWRILPDDLREWVRRGMPTSP